MKIKTSDLNCVQLDWAVAKCEGYRVRRNPFSGTVYDNFEHFYWVDDHDGEEVILDLGWIRPGYQSDYSPSTNWSQGGLIIERENITIIRADDDYEKDDQSPSGLRSIPAWFAECDQRVGHSLYISYEVESMEPAFIIEEGWGYYGPTPLIAAMRCYVALVLGDEVDIPDELIRSV